MYFFKELKDYIGFSDSDAECLRKLHPLLGPYFEEIANHFYRALNENQRTREIFTGEAQIARLRNTLFPCLTEDFHGGYDDTSFRARQRLGRIHAEVGLQPHHMVG